jgi:hypothetical protein
MPKRVGRCALTGEQGSFIKSHLLPRALTPPRSGGTPFPQIGSGKRPVKRLDSWYDLELVTKAGEDILTAYDTYAINELRRLKLVWQSWGPMLSLSTSDYGVFPAEPYGLRLVRFSDVGRMRRFLLSLLWRAVATSLPEFSEIQVSASNLRRLRRYVRDGDDPPVDFFPATLTQLADRGPSHNLGPLAQVKPGVQLGSVRTRDLPIFRFYFDGLIVHFHRDVGPEDIAGMEPFIVGAREATTISTVRSASSWELKNLALCIDDALRMYPDALGRAGGL